ncbi:MAG: hypothetical protein HY057_06190 [Rhodospirillales bacterium]|nr:hypothetical protein [Rhodospirillales bacterium]
MSPELETDSDEARRRYERETQLKESMIEANRRAADLGIAALKAALLINGAAAIALLTFVSQLALRDSALGPRAVPLVSPLTLLVLGVLSAALAIGLGYLRAYFETTIYSLAIMYPNQTKKRRRLAFICFGMGIICTIGSYAFFLAGILGAGNVIKALLE